MQALILAAGRGSRLGSKSEQTPKCLLEVGRRPLVEHQLETLAEAGVAPVAMVVGYCADEIREAVGIRAEYIHNHRWNVTNSLYSFWLARDWVNDSLVVLNSDTLVDPEILERLLKEKGSAFAYDSSSGDAREHMKVQVDNGYLVDMGKDLPADKVSGENVGILKFTAEAVQSLFSIADQLVKEGSEKDWLGSAVRKLAQIHPMQAVDIAGIAWGEVDSSYDLDRMRKKVLPAIQRGSRRQRRTWRSVLLTLAAGLFGLLSYLVARTWVMDPEVSWENVALTGASAINLSAGDRSQEWWLLDAKEPLPLVARVTGPGTVSIDSRVMVPQTPLPEIPYVIEVMMDDRLLDWFKLSSPASASWKHGEQSVGRQERLSLELPAGDHTLALRLAAAPSGQCLVRVRHLATEQED